MSELEILSLSMNVTLIVLLIRARYVRLAAAAIILNGVKLVLRKQVAV